MTTVQAPGQTAPAPFTAFESITPDTPIESLNLNWTRDLTREGAVMGLDIGIMKVEYLPRPRGIVYDFARDMAAEGAIDAYMFGEGNSWIPFTQRQVLRMLDAFTRERRLSPQERLEVRSWIESLPWVGWQDALPPPSREPDGDEEDDDGGGTIELHFNW